MKPRFLVYGAFFALATATCAAEPIQRTINTVEVPAYVPDPGALRTLTTYYPALARLFAEYRTDYGNNFGYYAQIQGFRNPYEKLGISIHEMIHVDTATRGGYWMPQGNATIGVTSFATLNHLQIEKLRRPEERVGLVYQSYVTKTPRNHLGNAVDELNAVIQTADFICRFEPTSRKRQLDLLEGHLGNVLTFLRISSEQYPEVNALIKQHDQKTFIEMLVVTSLRLIPLCGGSVVPWQIRLNSVR